MRQLHKFQIGISIFFGAFFVSLAYEIKSLINFNSNTGQSIVAITLSFILSTITANFATTILVKIKWIRKYLFRNHWIEGFWYNIDQGTDKEPTVFNATAITEIKFRDPSLGFQTVGFRLSDNKEIYTFSQYVLLIGANNFYINFTTSSVKGAFRSLVAIGFFFQSPGSSFIDTYDGIVADVDGDSCFKQRAKKLSPKKVKALKRKYGNDWVRKVLIQETSKETIN